MRDQLLERIQSGTWAPGEPLPSEFDIADEFGVSQGTARTAVAALAAESIVVRRQGLGTFVYEHTPKEELSRFSCLFDARHGQIDAEGRDGRLVRAGANPTERRELRLAKGSSVYRVSRVRTRGGSPFAIERISLPETMFPRLGDHKKLPNALYELYQKAYGVLVVNVEDRLTAISADRQAATALGIETGTPLLRIERVAFALKDKPVEWRVSLCYLQNAHYRTRLK